ncbi:MAG: permease [Candidatus Peregrinibacteria bacterium]|nr:permease [Candidatus Peregrinibacteria bacterium]
METAIVESGLVVAVIGAAFSVVLSGIGSSLGICLGGTKGAGVLAEKSHLFGKVLPLVALPGSQGFYGLLISIFILMKIDIFGEGAAISAEVGYQLLAAGILMGIAGLTSAWLQGYVVAASVGAVARDESLSVRAIILSALIETYAILGLLIAMFLTL